MNEPKIEDRDALVENRAKINSPYWLGLLVLFALFLGWLIWKSEMRDSLREIERSNYELAQEAKKYKERQQRAEKQRDEYCLKCAKQDGVPLFTFGWRVVCVKQDAVVFLSDPPDLDPL